jgi:hypothetical protein
LPAPSERSVPSGPDAAPTLAEDTAPTLAAPVVHVRIGRVEVRAAVPPAAAPKPQAARAKAFPEVAAEPLTLKAYLDRARRRS